MGFWKTCKECVKLVWGVACLWIAWKGCTLSFRFLGWAARYVERSVVFTALLTKRTAQSAALLLDPPCAHVYKGLPTLMQQAWSFTTGAAYACLPSSSPTWVQIGFGLVLVPLLTTCAVSVVSLLYRVEAFQKTMKQGCRLGGGGVFAAAGGLLLEDALRRHCMVGSLFQGLLRGYIGLVLIDTAMKILYPQQLTEEQARKKKQSDAMSLQVWAASLQLSGSALLAVSMQTEHVKARQLGQGCIVLSPVLGIGGLETLGHALLGRSVTQAVMQTTGKGATAVGRAVAKVAKAVGPPVGRAIAATAKAVWRTTKAAAAFSNKWLIGPTYRALSAVCKVLYKGAAWAAEKGWVAACAVGRAARLAWTWSYAHAVQPCITGLRWAARHGYQLLCWSWATTTAAARATAKFTWQNILRPAWRAAKLAWGYSVTAGKAGWRVGCATARAARNIAAWLWVYVVWRPVLKPAWQATVMAAKAAGRGIKWSAKGVLKGFNWLVSVLEPPLERLLVFLMDRVMAPTYQALAWSAATAAWPSLCAWCAVHFAREAAAQGAFVPFGVAGMGMGTVAFLTLGKRLRTLATSARARAAAAAPGGPGPGPDPAAAGAAGEGAAGAQAAQAQARAPTNNGGGLGWGMRAVLWMVERVGDFVERLGCTAYLWLDFGTIEVLRRVLVWLWPYIASALRIAHAAGRRIAAVGAAVVKALLRGVWLTLRAGLLTLWHLAASPVAQVVKGFVVAVWRSPELGLATSVAALAALVWAQRSGALLAAGAALELWVSRGWLVAVLACKHTAGAVLFVLGLLDAAVGAVVRPVVKSAVALIVGCFRAAQWGADSAVPAVLLSKQELAQAMMVLHLGQSLALRYGVVPFLRREVLERYAELLGPRGMQLVDDRRMGGARVVGMARSQKEAVVSVVSFFARGGAKAMLSPLLLASGLSFVLGPRWSGLTSWLATASPIMAIALIACVWSEGRVRLVAVPAPGQAQVQGRARARREAMAARAVAVAAEAAAMAEAERADGVGTEGAAAAGVVRSKEASMLAVIKAAGPPKRLYASDTCPICFGDWDEDGQGGDGGSGEGAHDGARHEHAARLALHCGHQFHTDCVLGWLCSMPEYHENRRRCPMCREPIHGTGMSAAAGALLF